MNKIISDPNAYVNQLQLFTHTFLNHAGASTSTREIECLKVQYPMMFLDIQEGDLFAGRERYPLIGFLPQVPPGFGYYIDKDRFNEVLDHHAITPENKKICSELIDFWMSECSSQKCRDAYPPRMREVLSSDNWQTDPIIAAPLYRMSGTQCDFDKLIRLGIPGLKDEVRLHKNSTQHGSKANEFYTAMEQALDLLSTIALYYADMAKDQVGSASPSRRAELLEMESTLRNIASNPPSTFRESLQLVVLYANMSGTFNYGRMDVYMGDLLARELDSGTLTEDQAIKLLLDVWKLIDVRGNIWDSRVFVGGLGRRNEQNADRFALLAMEVTRRARTVVPQFSLRFHKDQDHRLYKTALDVISSGMPYPVLYNDDVNIPSVMKAFNVPKEEAIHYLPYGCGEYILYHRSVGTPSGVINLLQALNVTLNKGISPVNGEPIGLTASELGDFETFEDLFRAYKKNVELHVEQLAYQEKLEYDFAGQAGPFLYLSLLFDDCIARGKGLYDGGVRYLGGTLESYGNTNTANSLAAIKKLVYDEKRFTLDELRAMLKLNFSGHEKERMLLLEAPKYGNDLAYADDILLEVHDHICTFTRDMASKAGLHSYLVVIINNSANTTMGLQTSASADGRFAYTFMANGNSPTGGTDTKGLTAMLNSLVKPSTCIHAGAVQNMKFSTGMLTTYRQQTEDLLETYWHKGGAQAMITCIGRDDLENAMKNPSAYTNLIVRVGGFSARFVELPREVQLEILSRTMY